MSAGSVSRMKGASDMASAEMPVSGMARAAARQPSAANGRATPHQRNHQPSASTVSPKQAALRGPATAWGSMAKNPAAASSIG